MGFGPIEIAWMLFVFVATPMLALLKIAKKRDQPRNIVMWGVLSWAGFVIGTIIMLSRPKGEDPQGERDDDYARFDLR